MTYAPHQHATGSETGRVWTAPSGIRTHAARTESRRWKLIAGPATLIGREWRHMRDLRSAVRDAK